MVMAPTMRPRLVSVECIDCMSGIRQTDGLVRVLGQHRAARDARQAWNRHILSSMDILSPSLDSLETFVTIARLRGFARAGTVLHCSQPAISRRIALLEGELN